MNYVIHIELNLIYINSQKEILRRIAIVAMEDRAVAVLVVLVLRAIIVQPQHLDKNRTIQAGTVTDAQKPHHLDKTMLEIIQWVRQRMTQIRGKVRNIYTGCPRRNVPNFGRVFLRSNYTDITQNNYIQSSMVTEILAIEKCGLLAESTHCTCQLKILSLSVLACGVVLRQYSSRWPASEPHTLYSQCDII
jgi:hypothetical protein